MRLDDAQGRALAFDNMQDRPLRGTGGFQTAEVVLDVPEAAERLSFGVVLHGPGALWVRQLSLEAVDDEVASTDVLRPLRAQAAAAQGAAATPPRADASAAPEGTQ